MQRNHSAMKLSVRLLSVASPLLIIFLLCNIPINTHTHTHVYDRLCEHSFLSVLRRHQFEDIDQCVIWCLCEGSVRVLILAWTENKRRPSENTYTNTVFWKTCAYIWRQPRTAYCFCLVCCFLKCRVCLLFVWPAKWYLKAQKTLNI